jgi:hypothetical protein
MSAGLSGKSATMIIVDEYTSRAEIVALIDAGVTVFTSRSTYRDPYILEAMPYREPRQPPKPKPERHWIQQHPKSQRKGR